MPLGLEAIEAALGACDLFVAIGTSGQVYPAAGFVETVRRAGTAHTIELNFAPSAVARGSPSAVTAPPPRWCRRWSTSF